MHTVGKVFLGLSIVAAIGTIALAGKLLNKRNELTQRLDTLRKQAESVDKEVVAKREELRALKQDAALVMINWDKYWNDAAVTVNADGTLTANVGTNNSVNVPAAAELPTLYAYMPMPDGTSLFVGQFQTTAVRENDTAMRPNWRVRPGEVANWKSGNWRLRSLSPPIFVGHFQELQTALTKGDEILARRQQDLSIQDNELKVAQKQLKDRQEELLGFENPPPKAELLETEYTKGLIAALAEEDEARNAELVEVDRLRRDVKIAFRKQEALIGRNQRLAASLPGNSKPAPSDEPAVSSTVPAKR